MKVIFLDIDGPMVPRRAFIYNRDKGTSSYLDTFDPCAVSLLLELLKQTKAKLVISSTWRLKGYDRVVKLLEDNGISRTHLHPDWRTHTDNYKSRAEQIETWLENHPEITNYVAIDDDIVKVDNFVYCTNADGFLLDHFFQMGKYLGPSEKEEDETSDED